MKRFVNFLSGFRIAAAFAIIPMIMFGWYWTTFIVYVLAAASDFFDGYLAKKYNATSKLGGVMDHIGDKLLVANTMIMLAIMMPVWFVVVPVIIMISRELYISGLREFLGTQKMEMPVPAARFSLGKVKTTMQMITIAAFLLMFAVAASLTPTMTSRFVMFMIYALPSVGVFCMWASLVFSIVSAAQYTRTFAEKMKKIK